MNQLDLDKETGRLYLSGVLVAPVTIEALRAVLKTREVVLVESGGSEFCKFGGDVTFCGEAFGLNITYQEANLYSVWLAWDGGISALKGYETSTAELLSDKRTISRILGKCLAIVPEPIDSAHDSFSFSWGSVSVAVALKSSMITLGVSWKN